MAGGARNAVGLVVAFALGALVAGLASTAVRDGGGPSAAAGPPEQMETAHGETRSENGGGTPSHPHGPGDDAPAGGRRTSGATAAAEALSRAVGEELTDDEIAFLRERLAEERVRRSAAVVRPEDDGIEILTRYLESRADVLPLLRDADALRAHVRTPEEATRQVPATGDRTSVDLSDDLDEVAVIEFGPGTFELQRGQGWNVLRKDVQALEIRGAGMDATRLVGPGWALLCADEDVSLRNLVIRDLTIDAATASQIVLDARGGVSAAIERVRFDGWQSAGHGSPLGVTGRALLLCRDCEFLGRGGGKVLSLRGSGLAAFERCLFSDVDVVFIGPGDRARPAIVQVTDCTFLSAPLADSRIQQGDTPGVELHVRGGTVLMGNASTPEDAQRERWGAKHAATVEGVAFKGAPAVFPLPEFLRAVQLANDRGMRDLVLVHVTSATRGIPAEIDFYEFQAGASPKRTTLLLTAQGLEVPPKPALRQSMGTRSFSREDLERLLPLTELLRRSPLDPNEEVRRVELTHTFTHPDGSKFMAAHVETADDRRFLLDASTGEDLSKR